MNLKIIAKVECHKTIFEQREGVRAPSLYFYAGCDRALAFFGCLGDPIGFISYPEMSSLLSNITDMGFSVECSVNPGDELKESFTYSWCRPKTVENHLNDLFGAENYKSGVWSVSPCNI